jgi:hypothetical protein
LQKRRDFRDRRDGSFTHIAYFITWVDSMRRSILPLLLFSVLLAGCGLDEPLAPELQGRWAAPNATKLRFALIADRLQDSTPIPTVEHDTGCSQQYVTFGKKRGISLHIDGKISPLFLVREVKRDRSRLILVGHAPLAAGSTAAQIELKLRDGQVRFDDIVDERGRSIRYDRLENERARRVGITTIGDVFRLVLDLKPCWT